MCGSAGYLLERVHHHHAAQPASASERTRLIEDVQADAADLVRNRGFEGKRIFRHCDVRPHDQLIVAIRVRFVEPAGGCDEVETDRS